MMAPSDLEPIYITFISFSHVPPGFFLFDD